MRQLKVGIAPKLMKNSWALCLTVHQVMRRSCKLRFEDTQGALSLTTWPLEVNEIPCCIPVPIITLSTIG